MPYVLVLYYSRHGSVASLAQAIAAGVDSIDGIEAKIRCVPEVAPSFDTQGNDIPDDGPLYCEQDVFTGCSGLAMGSPGRFGNMAAPLKYFLEQTTSGWVNGALIGKPATVFTSTTSEHGGQESTLLSMMTPLFHHGMLLCGVPFSEPALHKSVNGGTPYGVSHVATANHLPLHKDIEALARSQGQRIARIALGLIQ